MNIERAIEILNPTHREHYSSIEPVNEACCMGMNALYLRIKRSPYPDGDTRIWSCPNCGSGEFLLNEDGNRCNFCGQCGQAIDWNDNQET